MVSDAEMLDEIDARLAAVADVQFALVQKIRQQIETTEDAAELSALAEPLDRCARSIRLTYALRVKLRKDIRALDRDEARMAESRHLAVSRKHWDEVRSRVQTLTWREIDWEEEDEDEFAERLDRALDLECLDEAFLDLPVAQQADRVIRRLGLKSSDQPLPHRGRWSEGPEGGGSKVSDHHSSA